MKGRVSDRREAVALGVMLLILVGLPAITLGYQYVLRPRLASTRVIDINAAAPEAGGFAPDTIQVEAGETVTLRFAALDVTHGVALGPGLGVDLGDIDPGQVKEVTLTFDQPGTYTFYCNTWCSPNHWRMRGVIEVRDRIDPGALPAPQRDPVIEALATEGVDIDATVHKKEDSDHAPMDRPDPPLPQPSLTRGRAILETLSVLPELHDETWRRSHTPAQGLEMLAATNPAVAEAQLVNAVAALWVGEPVPSPIDAAALLYDKNCAACHGQTGGGDGPAATLTANEPAAFGDPAYMFTVRGDVLYAKIRRGGMGTDMPNFGTVFTPEETWALVRYLWTLAFSAREAR